MARERGAGVAAVTLGRADGDGPVAAEHAARVDGVAPGRQAGEGKLTMTFPRHGLEPFEVGRDSITPVDPAYKDNGVFAFTGKIEKVAFELTPAKK